MSNKEETAEMTVMEKYERRRFSAPTKTESSSVDMFIYCMT